MTWGIPSARAFLACALIGIAGCATTRYEPPPAVIEQPPDITAEQAIAAGQAAETKATTEIQKAQRLQRSRPTGRSTEEIRRQNANSPYPWTLNNAWIMRTTASTHGCKPVWRRRTTNSPTNGVRWNPFLPRHSASAPHSKPSIATTAWTSLSMPTSTSRSPCPTSRNVCACS